MVGDYLSRSPNGMEREAVAPDQCHPSMKDQFAPSWHRLCFYFARDRKWFLGPDLSKQVPWPEPWRSIPVYLYQIGLFHVCCLCLKRIPCPRWENLHSLEHHCARRCGRFHVSLEVNHRESATGQGMVLWHKLLRAFSGSISVFLLHHFGLESLMVLESNEAFKDC